MAGLRYGADDQQVLPRNDAYTGILAISLFAMLIACLLLFVDYYSYEGMKPPKTKELLTPIGAGKAPAPKGDLHKPAGKEEKAAPKQPEKAKMEDKAPAKAPPAEMKKDGDKMKKDGDKMEKKDDAKKDDKDKK